MAYINQKGFEAVGVIVAVLLLTVVGFAGYKVVTMNKSADTAASVANTAKEVAVPEKIETKADLVQTGKALDTSGTELDSSLNDGSLDADVDSML